MTEQQTPSNTFGFEFTDNPPPPSKSREVDTSRWEAVKVFLENDEAVGQWLKVKEYNTKQGATAKASQINNDNTKAFPAAEWEARYKWNDEDNTSVLYLMYKGKPEFTETAEQE